MAAPLHATLADRVRAAVVEAFGPEVRAPEPVVSASKDDRHGDYTCSAPMALARVLGAPPLGLAERLAGALDVDDLCEEPSVAPPGFVNLRLRSEWLGERVAASVIAPRLGLLPAAKRLRVVVDYSAPNVAKEMHVGHLRSTLIGDALANLAELEGHDVERVNHLGDWGTQFGMLIAHLNEVAPESAQAGADVDLGDVVTFYRQAQARFESEPEFAAMARAKVVDLQTGEASARAAWSALVELSRRENDELYGMLGVHGLIERGESFYQSMLADVVNDLEVMGLAVEDHGATCVFVDGFTNKEGNPLPLIVRNSQGGFNYATTDLAAVRHRVGEGADRILYVVDGGQSQHLSMVFAVARMAGWLPAEVEATHVAFGLVLGEDGRRLRTRSGESLPLRSLLDEAVERAGTFLRTRAAEREVSLPDDPELVARVVGVGAVKYGELSQHRQSNYVFSFDKTLTLKGNTAPYLQYAYARIRSILREAGTGHERPELDHPEERALAKRLVELADVLDRVGTDNEPHHLCAYLYDLSQLFNHFYENCPVLRSPEPVRSQRLVLCRATAATLQLGLALLGVEVLERV